MYVKFEHHHINPNLIFIVLHFRFEAYWGEHPELFAAIADGKSEEDRALRVLRWFIVRTPTLLHSIARIGLGAHWPSPFLLVHAQRPIYIPQ